MTVHVETTFLFFLPDDYTELKKFEAENDLSKFIKSEDTIATRYKYIQDINYSENRTDERIEK